MFAPLPTDVSNLGTSTSLRPYLQLPHILSLTWLAYPVISLLFVIFRMQISAAEAQSAANNAKDDFLTACQAAEHAATSAASMPRYLAVATNHQFADAVNGTMNGAREALLLALTCMETIINFLIDIYRSTFLCFLELVVVGGLDLLIKAVQDITSFLQSTLDSIGSSLKNDATDLNSAIQDVVDVVNKVNPFGKITAPQFNVTKLDALSNITIPIGFEDALMKLNSSLPTVSSIKSSIQDLVDTPFEDVKADINNTFQGINFDPTLLPVPAQNSVTFCSNLDTSPFDNLGDDLLKITKIGTIILVIVLILLLACHSILEWHKWHCLMKHLRNTRKAWMSDPAISQMATSKVTPSVTLTDHNLLMLQAEAQHPLLTRIAYMLAARLRFTPSQHVHLRWFLHYIFHPPALACFLIGFFGLLSVQIQLFAIHPLESHYATQASASVQDLSNTIAIKMNNSMYNQSAAYANDINTRVEAIQSTINDGLFGWVNGTTTTLNTTLNNFYTDVQDLVGTLFNGTILETPAQDFIKCLIGKKVDAIEEALTFLNQNLHVDLPQVNETVLVLSPTDIDEIIRPISTAAIGGSSSNPQGLVGRLVTTYVASLKKERLLFGIFMGLWLLVVLMGLAVVFWHSYSKDWVDAYKKRKWQKEQQNRLEGFVMPFKEVAPVPHVGDTEKGLTPDPPVHSFTPLPEPEAPSPLSISLFRRPNQLVPPSNHPLKSLEPAFEKSWDSFFREGVDNKQPEVFGLDRDTSRSMKFISFGKKGDDPEGDCSEGKPRFAWFKPMTRLFSRKDTEPPVPEFVVNRPPSGSRSPIPQLTISVEQASTAIPGDLPKIDTEPTLVDGKSPALWSASAIPPKLPWMKNIPPKKAVPLTFPPPPPGLPRKTSVSMDVGSVPPDHGPLAMPLHNAFEERPRPHKPVHLTFYPATHPSRPDSISSRERHKRSSTVAVSMTVVPPPTGPISRHESTRSTSRLLTNMVVQSPGELVDPFATPFDDDAGIVSPVKTKRITNPFTGVAL